MVVGSDSVHRVLHPLQLDPQVMFLMVTSTGTDNTGTQYFPVPVPEPVALL